MWQENMKELECNLDQAISTVNRRYLITNLVIRLHSWVLRYKEVNFMKIFIENTKESHTIAVWKANEVEIPGHDR